MKRFIVPLLRISTLTHLFRFVVERFTLVLWRERVSRRLAVATVFVLQKYRLWQGCRQTAQSRISQRLVACEHVYNI